MVPVEPKPPEPRFVSSSIFTSFKLAFTTGHRIIWATLVPFSIKKKFLPVLIQDKSDTFRKIRDHENNSGWIHISQLSKKKAALTIDDDVLVFNKPTIYSTPKVILKKGRLCKIKKCKDEWCNITVDKFKGWVKKDSLWGLL